VVVVTQASAGRGTGRGALGRQPWVALSTLLLSAWGLAAAQAKRRGVAL
jgi:hypothetical protein